MTTEKLYYIRNGKSLKVFGWGLLGFGMLYVVLWISGGLETENGTSGVIPLTIMLILLGFGGFLCLRKGSRFIKRGETYSRYLAIVHEGDSTRIEDIANAYPTTYEKAVADLQAMIDDGFFMNCYLDFQRGELVMPQPEIDFGSMDRRPRVVKCPNCGAPNKIEPDEAAQCQYCGSPL